MDVEEEEVVDAGDAVVVDVVDVVAVATETETTPKKAKLRYA